AFCGGKPAGWRFRPHSIGTSRHRLVLTKPFGCDVSNDKVLWRHRLPSQPPKHRQLSRVRHCICEWPLEQLLRFNTSELGVMQVPGHIRQHLVKSLYLGCESRQRFRPIFTPDKIRPCVPEHTCHVANEFGGSANVMASTKLTEIFGGIPQCFLGSVCNRCKEV